MSHQINRNTMVFADNCERSVRRAIEVLYRDIKKTCRETEAGGMNIRLVHRELPTEQFHIRVANSEVQIQAGDDLGFIYGLYEISRAVLGVNDFWFWNDQVFEQQSGFPVAADYQCDLQPYRVSYRGWFVNDEVLIHTWSVNRCQDEPWEMVFEALLRCGGNMVIPGTDRNGARYHELAIEMGLYVTHHHAEPLGAEMFARAYPSLNPSFAEHREKFIGLWSDAIQWQKEEKIVWNLGFRGQGDCPFWVNDPQYDTQESRGQLISELIGYQYELVKAADPHAVCCTNLYGETMELYQEGMLTLPDEIIKIWADNGYGKMVSRRQGNHNPRIPALPSKGSSSKNGIYYHVSFYDLQAANHITMLQNSPDFVRKELLQVLEHGGDDYWLVNCSNVKPHVYFLDLVAAMWRDGDTSVEEHRSSYIRRYYGENQADLVAQCFKLYPQYAVAYGDWEDEKAGEQFNNHVPRMFVSDYMKNEKRSEEMLWAVDADSLREQLVWYENLCRQAVDGYQQYLKKCEETAAVLTGAEECLFRDSLLLQVQLQKLCYSGAYLTCRSLLLALDGDYKMAFYQAGKAREQYLAADCAMRSREHGKWKNFYANECLTDIKQTAWVLQGLMSYLRNLGDGPHFFKWQKEYLYAEEDRRILLILNMENHLTDEELYQLMEEREGN